MLKRVSRKTSQGLPELEVFAKLEAPAAPEIDCSMRLGRKAVAAGQPLAVEVRARLAGEAKGELVRLTDQLRVHNALHAGSS